MKLKLQKGIDPQTEETIWLMLDADKEYEMVEPIQRYLTFLSTSKSPKTVESYGYGLKAWWEFLNQKQLDWKQIKLNDLSDFAYWLRVGVNNNVVSMQPVLARKSESSINHAITVVSTFYEYQIATSQVDSTQLYKLFVPRSLSKRSLLAGIAKAKPMRQKLVHRKGSKPFPGCLNPMQVETLVNACNRLRDKLIILMLYHTGMRKGELLGLCHCDIGSFNDYSVSVVKRINPNGARAKGLARVIPVAKEVLQLYDEYLIYEYPESSSPYVFVNIWSGQIGAPMNPLVLNTMFKRLSSKTGITVYPHLFRHSFATRLLKSKYPVERVKYLLGHTSVQTTLDIYSHIVDLELLNTVVKEESKDE